jgi:hypothetical protein
VYESYIYLVHVRTPDDVSNEGVAHENDDEHNEEMIQVCPKILVKTRSKD